MEGIPDTKFQMKEIWKVLGKYDKIEKSPTDVPIWEMWKVPMKYKTVFFPLRKSFDQYDMWLVSIGHFSYNIGHILESRVQKIFGRGVNIFCKGNGTRLERSICARWWVGTGGSFVRKKRLFNAEVIDIWPDKRKRGVMIRYIFLEQSNCDVSAMKNISQAHYYYYGPKSFENHSLWQLLEVLAEMSIPIHPSIHL